MLAADTVEGSSPGTCIWAIPVPGDSASLPLKPGKSPREVQQRSKTNMWVREDSWEVHGPRTWTSLALNPSSSSYCHRPKKVPSCLWTLFLWKRKSPDYRIVRIMKLSLPVNVWARPQISANSRGILAHMRMILGSSFKFADSVSHIIDSHVKFKSFFNFYQ